MAYVYCTPMDVAKAIDMPDPSDPAKIYTFSEFSHPSVDTVEDMIESNMDIIDRVTNDSWRVNMVKNLETNLNSYWHDENGCRCDYMSYGGYKIQLEPNILQWDPTMGDKLELRTYRGVWIDVTRQFCGDNEAGATKGNMGAFGGFRIDYSRGAVYIATSIMQNMSNAVRISYRYGHHGEPPKGIKRLCTIMTARRILSMQMLVKVGSGGDLGNYLSNLNNELKQEEAELRATFQRVSPPISLYR